MFSIGEGCLSPAGIGHSGEDSYGSLIFKRRDNVRSLLWVVMCTPMKMLICKREAVAVNSVNEAFVVDHMLVVVRPVLLGLIDGPGCKGGTL